MYEFSVVGTGFGGRVSGACVADIGGNVTGVDTNSPHDVAKVSTLNPDDWKLLLKWA